MFSCLFVPPRRVDHLIGLKDLVWLTLLTGLESKYAWISVSPSTSNFCRKPMIKFISSWFITGSRSVRLSTAELMLVSPANIFPEAEFKQFGRSLIYIKNNNGPIILPWGTPHLKTQVRAELASSAGNSSWYFRQQMPWVFLSSTQRHPSLTLIYPMRPYLPSLSIPTPVFGYNYCSELPAEEAKRNQLQWNFDLTNYQGTEEMRSLYQGFVKSKTSMNLRENNQNLRYIEVKCKFAFTQRIE